jgi:hypothetical protein
MSRGQDETTMSDRDPECIDGAQLLSLHYAGAVKALSSDDGRKRMVESLRSTARNMTQKLGWECARTLRAADAVERANWPVVGRLLREIEAEDWVWTQKKQEAEQADHRAILSLADRLEKEGIP